MKLLQKTGYYYLIFSLLIFLLGGLVMFITLRVVLDNETDEGLQHTRSVLKEYLLEMDSFPVKLRIMDEEVELIPVASMASTEFFSDSLLYDPAEAEYLPHRKYTYVENLGTQAYRITISHSRVESEDLITTILLVNLGILGLLLLFLNQLNRVLSRRLWQPFYQTIQKIKTFSIQDEEKLHLGTSEIEEFAQLNRGIEQMTAKLQRDYRSLRRFTENAGHELQTPLAIMRNQVDLLLQNAERPPADFESIGHLSEAITRLGRLNKALLLLTRIENQQYAASEFVNLLPALQEKMAALQPLLEERQLALQSELSDCILEINPVLADVLLNNLLENAIKHNVPNGQIKLELNPGKLMIANTGHPISGATEELFERFTKGRVDNQSLGLGLAIVQEICTLYKWSIRYRSDGNWHEVLVGFAN